MNLLNLINELDVPDTDYWYDLGCDFARKIIDEDPEAFIISILNEWRTWPEARQVHLAYILGEGTSTQELELIKQMITSPCDELVFTAKEALIEFNQKT